MSERISFKLTTILNEKRFVVNARFPNPAAGDRAELAHAQRRLRPGRRLHVDDRDRRAAHGGRAASRRLLRQGAPRASGARRRRAVRGRAGDPPARAGALVLHVASARRPRRLARDVRRDVRRGRHRRAAERSDRVGQLERGVPEPRGREPLRGHERGRGHGDGRGAPRGRGRRRPRPPPTEARMNLVTERLRLRDFAEYDCPFSGLQFRGLHLTIFV